VGKWRDWILYANIKAYAIPAELIDVVIIVGGIDSVSGIFDENLVKYLQNISYSNIVYVGSAQEAKFMRENKIVYVPGGGGQYGKPIIPRSEEEYIRSAFSERVD